MKNRLVLKKYFKGYRLNSQHLLLSQKGLFSLPFKQRGKLSQESEKRSLIEAVRFSCSTCYIARDSYWEHIAYYPTANLLEVYKIVQAEIVDVAPIEGKTYAYIINSSKNRTAVLYCCFPKNILATAQSSHLWRLLPETLPYYRYLFGKAGVYLTKLNVAVLNSGENKDYSVDHEKPVSRELLLKLDAEVCSSLPVNKDNEDMFFTATIADATVIDETEVIFNKFDPLSIIDFTLQAIEAITQLVSEKARLARYAFTTLIVFLLTFILGKSAFITWHHNYLTEKVAESKTSAVSSLKLSNELKKIKNDIQKINASLVLQVPKVRIYQILFDLIDEDNKLVFSTVDISSEEMQLRGTTKNSANLLTALSNVNGFNQVEFNTPPASLKQGGERFFITLRFDEKVKEYQVKVTENVIKTDSNKALDKETGNASEQVIDKELGNE